VTAPIRGMEKDNFEIKPGLSKVLKLLSRIAPQLALHASSKPVEATVAQKASTSVQASVR
jgi:uncharacterized oxidoreductase